MQGNGKISRKKEAAILALLTEPTIAAAAEKAGVSEATLWRWQQREDFRSEYKRAREQAVSQATAKLQQSANEAVETLRGIMRDSEAKDNARFNAAKAVLELSLKAVEQENVIDRIEELEQKLEAGGK